MEDETIAQRGRGVSAQMHQEMPLDYVARIRMESAGGALVFVDAAGRPLANSGGLAWRPLSPNQPDRLVADGPIDVGAGGQNAIWLRLVDAKGRDLGWRGPPEYARIETRDKDPERLLSLKIYPPR